MELIQALIPISLMAMANSLRKRVSIWPGQSNASEEDSLGIAAAGQTGAICLSDQNIKIRVHWVQNVTDSRKIAFKTYDFTEAEECG